MANFDDQESVRRNRQQTHYAMLSELTRLAREVPASFQQRLPYSTLSAIASSLLDGTVFEIVKHLYEIQQMTERKLMEQRAQLVNTHKVMKQEQQRKHRSELENCQSKPHNIPLVKHTNDKEKEALDKRIEYEINQMDERILLELDQRCTEQQTTLEKAGVHGFYCTSNPQEVKLQMYVLKFILKLSSMDFGSANAVT
ncbi:protein DGCR6-like [Amphiura filiformis]|uniref:protein DGCR6-like n=1 Tax=Amphiura filiformis TaxID=82378 RepID=UPI003B210C2B